MDSAALIDEFLELRDHLSLVHQVPGRIRLRLGAGLLPRATELGNGKLRQDLSALKGIREVRLNMAAASLVIEYDPRVMNQADWQAVFEEDETKARDILLAWFG